MSSPRYSNIEYPDPLYLTPGPAIIASWVGFRAEKLGRSGFEILQLRNIYKKTTSCGLINIIVELGEEYDNIYCVVVVVDWWVAVPKAQSSVSDTAGPTKCLQVLLGTL